MKLVFISDLHLAPNTPDKNQIFYQLLDNLNGGIDALYILGDFFDHWLGDDDMTPFAKEMMLHLSNFAKSTPTYFRGGNHDFAVGKNFAKKTNIKLIPDMHSIYTGKHKILLSHGDTFCTLDIGYQKMKKIIQNKFVVWLLLKTPLSWRYKIKDKMEQGSKNSNKIPKPDYIYNVVDESIIEYANQYGADTIIHGHTHHPGHYTVNDKVDRYETPDWEDNPAGAYLLYDDGEFSFNNINNA
ncbi:MAG: UDP-2,3-diacylglucosamine diphosphatase [Burkholderiales bacterium]|nr:UDP-2,3-diacylglucosamine diphosphatase [Burkholderiales bacterium]